MKSEKMLAMIMAMVISKTWQWWQWKPISLLLSDSLPQSSAALRVEPICSCHSDQCVVLPGNCFCFYREVLLHQLVRNPQTINFHINWFFVIFSNPLWKVWKMPKVEMCALCMRQVAGPLNIEILDKHTKFGKKESIAQMNHDYLPYCAFIKKS